VWERDLRRMRDRHFVPFSWERHWIRAFAVSTDTWASWDLFPPVKGYRPIKSKKKSYYVSLARQHHDWAASVISRDGGKCQQCGAASELEAHHIWPQSWFHHLRYLLRNGITLCKSCHQSANWNTEFTPNQFKWLTNEVDMINKNIERSDFWDFFTAGQQKGRLVVFNIKTDEIDWNSAKVQKELEWYKSLANWNNFVGRILETAGKEPCPDPDVDLNKNFVKDIETHDTFKQNH